MPGKKQRRNGARCKSLYLKVKSRKQDAISRMLKNYPCFVAHMLDDIMSIDGFSETEIGFGSSIPLETVRDIVAGNLKHLNQEVSLALLGLYARIFCNWWSYQDD
ncbi:MAG: hypothetical protein JW855_01940 [Gammaproteobacteria bacterium]|nr:hypothetical protein [Gammaproteobacteria bacterium]